MAHLARIALIAALGATTAGALVACSTFRTSGSDATDASAGDDGGASVDAGASTFHVVQRVADAGSLNAVWGANASSVHAVGDDGMIYDYDGTSWNAVVGTTGAKLGGVWGTGPNDVYAVGTLAADARGVVFHYDGSGWTEQIELPIGLVSVWGIADTVYAGGLQGTVYKKTTTRDWYQLIQLEPNPNITVQVPGPILFSIAGNAPDKVLVAGDVDTLYLFRGSSQWVPFYDPVDRSRAYRSVWGPPSATTSFFVGANYYGVWQLTDSPELLTLHEERDKPERKDQSVWGIWGPSSDRLIFVGDAGRIMTYDGGPDGLVVRDSPTDRSLFGVWGSSPDDVWIVGDDAVILHGSMP